MKMIKKKISEYEKKIEELEAQLKKSTIINENSNKKDKKLINQIKELEEENKKLKEKSENLNNKLQEAEKIKKKMKIIINQISKEKDDEKEKSKILINKYQEMQKKYKDLKTENENLSKISLKISEIKPNPENEIKIEDIKYSSSLNNQNKIISKNDLINGFTFEITIANMGKIPFPSSGLKFNLEGIDVSNFLLLNKEIKKTILQNKFETFKLFFKFNENIELITYEQYSFDIYLTYNETKIPIDKPCVLKFKISDFNNNQRKEQNNNNNYPNNAFNGQNNRHNFNNNINNNNNYNSNNNNNYNINNNLFRNNNDFSNGDFNRNNYNSNNNHNNIYNKDNNKNNNQINESFEEIDNNEQLNNLKNNLKEEKIVINNNVITKGDINYLYNKIDEELNLNVAGVTEEQVIEKIKKLKDNERFNGKNNKKEIIDILSSIVADNIYEDEE